MRFSCFWLCVSAPTAKIVLSKFKVRLLIIRRHTQLSVAIRLCLLCAKNCLTCATVKLHVAPCIAHNRLWTFVALLLSLFKVLRTFALYFLPLCFWAFALELDCIVSRFNRFVKPYFLNRSSGKTSKIKNWNFPVFQNHHVFRCLACFA